MGIVDFMRYESGYKAGYEFGYRIGFDAAINRKNISIEEFDKLCWDDEEWLEAGEEYIRLYNEIMEELPPHKKMLLFNLELAENRQNIRGLELLFEHLGSGGLNYAK